MRFLAAPLVLASVVFAQDRVDLSLVNRIKTEAFDNSKVMDTLGWLTDVHGPRLTGSPEYREAAGWAQKRLEEYGVQNVHFEKWGPFGRSWSVKYYSVEMIAPRYARLTAQPLAWTSGSGGPVQGEVTLAPWNRERVMGPKKLGEEFEKFIKEHKGKLRGKIVLLSEPRRIPDATQPQVRRWTDAELADMAKAPAPVAKIPVDPDHLDVPEDPEKRQQFYASVPWWLLEKLFEKNNAILAKRNQFLRDEGSVAVLRADDRAHTGLLFGEEAGPHEAKYPLALPIFAITEEQYNRLTRMLEKKVAATVRVSVDVEASSGDGDAFNVVGEIPGAAKPDELVMIGAHFDSWHMGTGTTDNATGSAVMIEVMRILKKLNLKLDRTVRIALWSGEEQGIFGSRAYVKEHFADPVTMKTTAQHGKLAGYFNLDNGSGKIRGVYLQGNDAMRPVFQGWLEPFRDLGASTVTIRNTGGTDHLSFDAVGLPGFQFIQDPLNYMSVTHHSDMDVFDHAQPADLMQASAIIATMVCQTANRAEMLPRKVMPEPLKTAAK